MGNLKVLHINDGGLDDPRIINAAATGKKAGYDVYFCGGNLKATLNRDIFTEIKWVDFTAQAKVARDFFPFIDRYWRWYPYSREGRKLKRQLKRIIDGIRPDIIHAHDIFAGHYAHYFGIPMVFDDHELYSVEVKTEYERTTNLTTRIKAAIKESQWDAWERELGERCPIITVSDAIAEHHRQYCTNVFVVPNYVRENEIKLNNFNEATKGNVWSVYLGADSISKPRPVRNIAGLYDIFYGGRQVGKLARIGVESPRTSTISSFGFLPMGDAYTIMRQQCHIGLLPWKRHWFHKYCLHPDTPILTKKGLKKVSQIKVGDYVYTHTGNWKKVINTFTREYSGQLVRIKTEHSPFDIVATPEHPFFTVSRSSYVLEKQALPRRPQYASEVLLANGNILRTYTKTQWSRADEITTKDYLAFPRMIETVDKNRIIVKYHTHSRRRTRWGIRKITCNRRFVFPLDENMMKICGYYLAEGYIHYRRHPYNLRKYPDSVIFTFGENDKELSLAVDCAKAIHTIGLHPIIYYTDSGRNVGWKVQVSSKALAIFLKSHFGVGSLRKYIHHKIKLLSAEKLDVLVDCLQKGDGTQDKRYDAFDISTSSLQLALDIRDVTLKVGYRVGVSKQRRKGFATIKGVETYIQDRYIIRCTFQPGRNSIPADTIYQYLRVREIERINYHGNVSNLEVEGDNSYASLFTITHNCSPNKVYEYAHCGLWLITIDDIPSVVKDFGPLCDTFEKYEELADLLEYYNAHTDELNEKRHQSIKHAQTNLIWEKNEHKILGAYKVA